MNKTICVLYGGKWSEREVSLNSGKAAADALKEYGYTNVHLVDVDFTLAEKLALLKPAVCFNALHGTYGEDGRLQGMLDMMNIPYTGSATAASVIAFDKVLTKMMFIRAGVPTADYLVTDTFIDVPFEEYVVKPVNEGSSVGLGIVHKAEEAEEAFKTAIGPGRTVIVEEFVKGKELTVSIFGDTVLPPIWIRPKKGVYDYESKYTAGMTEYLFDTGLTSAQLATLKHAAQAAYKIVGCKCAARVDFIFDGTTPYALEVNTVPGLTATSLVPKAAREAGISFPELTAKMIETAIADKAAGKY